MYSVAICTHIHTYTRIHTHTHPQMHRVLKLVESLPQEDALFEGEDIRALDADEADTGFQVTNHARMRSMSSSRGCVDNIRACVV